ncbi:MAG: SpoIIE family protein phosphatase [Clostridia bacterium]|nr:SpoIIE family protein phosphatase [Clostridia bacterium]
MKESIVKPAVAAERELHESAVRQMGRTLIGAMIGLLAAHATIYGDMAPFGVGAAASASGTGAVLVYLATMIGYLLPGGTPVALRYVAAVTAVGGLRWTLGGLRLLSDNRKFAPFLAFTATAATGVALYAVIGVTLHSLLLILCESLLAAGFAYVCEQTQGTALPLRDVSAGSLPDQVSIVVTVAVLLLSVSSVEIGGIAPGRILSILLILLCARAGREPGGSLAGVVIGVVTLLASPDRAYAGVAYAFGGLLAGLCSRYGKWAQAGVFFAASVLLSFGTGGIPMLIGLYEVLAASTVFLVLPGRAERWLMRFFTGAEEKPAVEGLRRSVVLRLNVASKAMKEVAGTVDEVSKKLAGISAPDLGSVYFGVSESVCTRCAMRLLCWERELSDTMDSLNHLSAPLRQRGRVTCDDVTGSLAKRCHRLDEIVHEINRGYGEHCLREGAFRRLSEIRSVVTDQFSGVAELLSEFSDDFADAEKVDVEAAEHVKEVCDSYHLPVREAVCTVGKGNRMRVEILASDAAVHIRQEEWLSKIGEVCGRTFDRPSVVRIGGEVRITLTERARYRVKAARAQLSCSHQRLCGDASEQLSDGVGHWLAVLSDGMGSGGRAAVDGAMAAGLTARLFSAGFGEDSVLRMVNSALMVKSGDESIATLDVMKIDLFSGRMTSLKAGAAPSLLCSHGRVSRMERSSLPMGILRDIGFEKQTDTLADGDVLLMLSDGALTGGIGWVEERLGAFDAGKETLQSLAEDIACTAREQQTEHQDDITVLALRVEKAA